jgi:transposase
MPRHSKDTVALLGIDIGKNTFHLIGLNKRGAIILRLKLSRTQLEAKLANLPPCLVGMEACVGAHHLSRRLKALGHDPRLMPARYVKAFLKGNKNDFRDAADLSILRSGREKPAAPRTLQPHRSLLQRTAGPYIGVKGRPAQALPPPRKP